MCWDRQVQREAVRPGWALPDEFLVGLDVEDKARSLTALVLWGGSGTDRANCVARYYQDTERLPKVACTPRSPEDPIRQDGDLMFLAANLQILGAQECWDVEVLFGRGV